MYNKIASLILNSAQSAGFSDVFVAQPDALKENLAGKFFVLAEIGGKRSDGQKIFDFLKASLEENYYNDEKILLRDKIEGLKIENIFEAALAKTNRALGEFLLKEKIHLNPTATNIALGVIYENKLHFSSFGKNRALLIYPRSDRYEIINVEASAATMALAATGDTVADKKRLPSLFSSVVSGEVPTGAYFIFTSEALPEYLSGKEMVGIITKLPPIVAAEQIKNVLSKINSYVPFLAVIIKNTIGLSQQEIHEETVLAQSAHSSIDTLNHTERKTEAMLRAAGLISFARISQRVKRTFDKWPKRLKSVRRSRIGQEKVAASPSQAPLDLGTVKSLRLARPDSFLVREKVFLKKTPSALGPKIRNFFFALGQIFAPRFWSGLFSELTGWFKNLTLGRRRLFWGLTALVIIFVVSLLITGASHRRQQAATLFKDLTAQISSQEDQIDAHLLYGDEEGAKSLLIQAQAAFSSLKPKSASEQASAKSLNDRLATQADKIQKIVRVGQALKVSDLAGFNASTLVYAGKALYAASQTALYNLMPAAGATTTNWTIAGAADLRQPQSDGKDLLYFLDGANIVQFNLKTKQSGRTTISDAQLAAGATGFQIFSNRLYLLAKSDNQVYVYTKGAQGFGSRSNWFKGTVDLTAAAAFGIDGNIYILGNTGAVMKFYKGQAQDYKAGPLSPILDNAQKIIAGNNNLYIFDPDAKRLAVLDKKDGHLLNQYQVDSLVRPKDFAVDEAGKTAYFLDGEAVYKIGLNQ